jgi:tryptophan halogenase
MSNRIEHITIVGGGTAGWLTALILNAHVNKNPRERTVKIALIESPKIPTIGVGESTIQNLKLALQHAGVEEAEFLRKSNGSFKLGVHFIDWSRTKDGASSRFFHPLNEVSACGGLHPAYHFRRFGPHWLGTSFGENILPNAAVIAAGKGPRPIHAPNYSWDINYAYHIDAGLFANFMRDFAVARGVEHIRDEVVDVFHDEAGAIAALQLEQRGRYPVEFVIDCTGFKSLIWSRMGAEPFISANDRLFNDRAIPLQIPHRDPTKIEPCTRATALGAGWAWRVPLYSRVGTGYVYSSAFRSDEEARAEFLAHLRATGDLPADASEPETRVIKMRIGYTRQPWIKNCVAIGLSSGFVEPLEATAIYTIDAAVHRVVMNFPDKQCSPALARAYNTSATALMEEIVDFLQMNYLTSNRTEPYWLAARQDNHISDWLREKLELWQLRFPDFNDTHKNVLFDHDNFIFVLQPRGYFAKIHSPLNESIRLEDWQDYGQALRGDIAKFLAALPSHYDLLSNIRESRPAPAFDLRLPVTAAARRF